MRRRQAKSQRKNIPSRRNSKEKALRQKIAWWCVRGSVTTLVPLAWESGEGVTWWDEAGRQGLDH